MTEKEIIEVLKSNIEDGVAFHFLADEIKDWVKKNIGCVKVFDGTKNDDEFWVNVSERTIPLTEFSVVALPDDFESRDGKWVDFQINEDGLFKVSNKYNTDIVFSWFEWQAVIRKFPELTSFGGWQYGDDSSYWVSDPRMYKPSNGSFVHCYENRESYFMRPATPKKIRFWMEVKEKDE